MRNIETLLFASARLKYFVIVVSFGLAFVSCEDYLKWNKPELLIYPYEVISCDNSYTWIDGNTYYTDNSDSTFIVAGEGGQDTLFELNLVFDKIIDTVKIWTCDSYTWIDGNLYTQSVDTASVILEAQNGCDSILVLDLTIAPLQGIDSISACNDFTWIDGITYSESNTTATYMLTSSSGCDSIVTLNLSINPLQGIDKVQSCGDFTWIDGNIYTENNNTATYNLTSQSGCDSIVTLDLTILTPTLIHDTIETCGPYTWVNGITYNNDNYNASVTSTGQNGCDSVTQLHLTMNCECSNAPNFNCSITTTTSNNAANSWYSMITTTGTTFQRGDSYTINMYSSQNYYFSPGAVVELCCNETVIYAWSGSSMVNFVNNICTFQIPTFGNQSFPNPKIKNDNCFTFRVRKNSDVWVSAPFSIL